MYDRRIDGCVQRRHQRSAAAAGLGAPPDQRDRNSNPAGADLVGTYSYTLTANLRPARLAASDIPNSDNSASAALITLGNGCSPTGINLENNASLKVYGDILINQDCSPTLANGADLLYHTLTTDSGVTNPFSALQPPSSSGIPACGMPGWRRPAGFLRGGAQPRQQRLVHLPERHLHLPARNLVRKRRHPLDGIWRRSALLPQRATRGREQLEHQLRGDDDRTLRGPGSVGEHVRFGQSREQRPARHRRHALHAERDRALQQQWRVALDYCGRRARDRLQAKRNREFRARTEGAGRRRDSSPSLDCRRAVQPSDSGTGERRFR